MPSYELQARARRAVACEGGRWMPGMLAHHPNWRAGRVSHVGLTAVRVACRYSSPVGGTAWAVPLLPITDLLPDLSDPATLGCMLALVAEAYGVTLDDVHVVRTTGMVWSVWIFRADDSSYRVATHEPSRAEALVAALEAAP